MESQREAQWNLDPFDMINTQSLFQNSSFSASLPRSSSSSTPSPFFFLHVTQLPLPILSSGHQQHSHVFCLPPFPPAANPRRPSVHPPMRTSQKPNPDPNSTNPFHRQLVPSPHRSLTPDFYTQQQVRSGLNRAMSAVVHSSTIPPSFSRQQSLVPAQAAAPVTQTQSGSHSMTIQTSFQWRLHLQVGPTRRLYPQPHPFLSHNPRAASPAQALAWTATGHCFTLPRFPQSLLRSQPGLIPTSKTPTSLPETNSQRDDTAENVYVKYREKIIVYL